MSVAAEENEAGTQTMMKMSEVLQAYLDTPPWDDSPAMYVVTTQGSYCGASAVLDAGIQQKLGEVFPDGCYILPSSIHKCLAVSSDMDVHALAHMVHDINRSEVAEQDRLSDHVFRLHDNTLGLCGRMVQNDILAGAPYGTLYGVTSGSKLGFVKASGHRKSLVTTAFL